MICLYGEHVKPYMKLLNVHAAAVYCLPVVHLASWLQHNSSVISSAAAMGAVQLVAGS